MEALATGRHACMLARAQLLEVLGRLRHNIRVQREHQALCRLVADGDVDEDPGQLHQVVHRRNIVFLLPGFERLLFELLVLPPDLRALGLEPGCTLHVARRRLRPTQGVLPQPSAIEALGVLGVELKHFGGLLHHLLPLLHLQGCLREVEVQAELEPPQLGILARSDLHDHFQGLLPLLPGSCKLLHLVELSTLVLGLHGQVVLDGVAAHLLLHLLLLLFGWSLLALPRHG
mmetsp:Transcript_46111/g.130783  ORF Transcript_46111/g.130783 Transcript_46111/m.130783 type:complete len:231 (+) Transcript_46111:434-1126(+)